MWCLTKRYFVPDIDTILQNLYTLAEYTDRKFSFDTISLIFHMSTDPDTIPITLNLSVLLLKIHPYVSFYTFLPHLVPTDQLS